MKLSVNKQTFYIKTWVWISFIFSVFPTSNFNCFLVVFFLQKIRNEIGKIHNIWLLHEFQEIIHCLKFNHFPSWWVELCVYISFWDWWLFLPSQIHHRFLLRMNAANRKYNGENETYWNDWNLYYIFVVWYI